MPVAVDHPGIQALLRLLDGGRRWVKLSGVHMRSKSGLPLCKDIGVLANAHINHAPERMVWVRDWLHPLATAQTMPDEAKLLDWAPVEEVRRRMLVSNPAKRCGFNSADHSIGSNPRHFSDLPNFPHRPAESQ